MKIIGINFLHADSSCCLMIDNHIVSAIEEERFVRKKHYSGFPENSLNFCLKSAGLEINQIDYFCFNFNKNYNFFNKLAFFFSNFRENRKLLKNIKINKNFIAKKFLKNKGVSNNKIKFVPHHISHASSVYLHSGLKDSIIFSFDGAGDFSTIEIYYCNEKGFQLLEQHHFPNSLGLFYQMITQYLGFKNFGDEFKVMSLACYGNTTYVEKILQIFDINEDNKFKIKKKYFNYFNCFAVDNFTTFKDFYTKEFENLLDFPPRKENDPINQNLYNFACSAQFIFKLIAINILKKFDKYSENLCLTGGCAFNSVFAGEIKNQNIFKKVFINSNSGDAGGALGAASYINFKKNIKFKNVLNIDPFLGPDYSKSYVQKLLDSKDFKNFFKKNNFSYEEKSTNEIIKTAAKKIYEDEIIFWFRGKSEFGPRALGNRSILANPCNKNIKDKINVQIKEREIFRPFAPAVIEERKDKYFYTHDDMYGLMNFVVKAKEDQIENIPAVIHVDGSARAQVVSREFNEDFYLLIKEFGKISGHPVLLNTSLNIQEPICNSPEDVISTFSKSTIKNLFLNNYHIYRL